MGKLDYGGLITGVLRLVYIIYVSLKLMTTKHTFLLHFFRHSVEPLDKIFSNFNYSKV